MKNLELAIRHIVHIDDDEEDYLMLVEAVKVVNSELMVTYLPDCPSLLNLSEYPTADLVFLDINMHGNDGFYWMEKIRAKGLTALPVIMYSTANSDHYISKAYHTGAHLFFTKPQTFTELVDSLRHILQMDWNEPHRIRDAHFVDGMYKPFRLN